jgi:hypothetical protein
MENKPQEKMDGGIWAGEAIETTSLFKLLANHPFLINF